MAKAGAHVVLAARDQAAVQAVCGGIRDAHGDATAVPADISRSEDVDRLFAVAQELGVPTALVCAAGVLTRVPFEETSRQTWERTLAVNLTGAFLCCRAAFAAMRRAGGGRIVNIASLSGVYATEKFAGLAAYNVSKYGIVGLTEAIAVEGRPHGITAVCISPGAVETDMLRRANPDLRARLRPADVAELIIALFEESWTAASGANIPLFSNA
jgi:3-oxoacyl-[acyl-carrier protein] reductase